MCIFHLFHSLSCSLINCLAPSLPSESKIREHCEDIHSFHNVENQLFRMHQYMLIGQWKKARMNHPQKRDFARHSLHVGCPMSFFLVFHSTSLWFVIGHHG